MCLVGMELLTLVVPGFLFFFCVFFKGQVRPAYLYNSLQWQCCVFMLQTPAAWRGAEHCMFAVLITVIFTQPVDKGPIPQRPTFTSYMYNTWQVCPLSLRASAFPSPRARYLPCPVIFTSVSPYHSNQTWWKRHSWKIAAPPKSLKCSQLGVSCGAPTFCS